MVTYLEIRNVNILVTYLSDFLDIFTYKNTSTYNFKEWDHSITMYILIFFQINKTLDIFSW